MTYDLFTIQGVCHHLEMIDMTWLSALLVGAGCFALGYLLSARYPACIFASTRRAKETSAKDGNKKSRTKEPLEIEKLADILEDFKMVSCQFALCKDYVCLLPLVELTRTWLSSY